MRTSNSIIIGFKSMKIMFCVRLSFWFNARVDKMSIIPVPDNSNFTRASHFLVHCIAISFPEHPLLLSSGWGNERSGRIQNRNHKIMVPV